MAFRLSQLSGTTGVLLAYLHTYHLTAPAPGRDFDRVAPVAIYQPDFQVHAAGFLLPSGD